MKTYYEQLDVKSDASEAEIQAAIDEMYNQWRQAVTHPDATIAEEANRNLRVLEEMRATLTDPVKRAGYDAGIGLGGAAGLADPAAVLKQMPAPLKSRNVASPSGERTGSGLWTCQKCKTDNPPQTRHCFSCGAKLVRTCPNCGQMASLIATGFCGNCGMQYEVAVRLAELRANQAASEQELKQAQSSVDETRAALLKVSEPKINRGSLVAVFAIAFLGILMSGLSEICAVSGIAIGVVGAVTVFSSYGGSKREYAAKKATLNQKLTVSLQRVHIANERLAACEIQMAKLEQPVSVV